jgi:hypothetical protein
VVDANPAASRVTLIVSPDLESAGSRCPMRVEQVSHFVVATEDRGPGLHRSAEGTSAAVVNA